MCGTEYMKDLKSTLRALRVSRILHPDPLPVTRNVCPATSSGMRRMASAYNICAAAASQTQMFVWDQTESKTGTRGIDKVLVKRRSFGPIMVYPGRRMPVLRPFQPLEPMTRRSAAIFDRA